MLITLEIIKIVLDYIRMTRTEIIMFQQENEVALNLFSCLSLCCNYGDTMRIKVDLLTILYRIAVTFALL